jgi:cytochrome c oxidase subunit 1
MGLFQIPFIFNFFWSIRHGEKAEGNVWQATTIEWASPSPAPHGNFLTEPQAYRGPYEYSVPGADKDFTPQFEA